MTIEEAQADIRQNAARHVFVNGFAPNLSEQALAALKTACETDDKRLTQGSTTTPPPLMCVQDWECEGACAMGYCGWQGGDAGTTVGQVEEYFAAKCFQADEVLGEPAACRYFLNWFDDTPRAEMLGTLAAWCGEALAARSQPAVIIDADPPSDLFN